MVWACFWGSGRSELYVMDRDPESKRNGYSSRSYLEVLEDQIPKLWSPGLIFMQDNAPIHTEAIIKRFFEEQGIEVSDWPLYSLDLNPIEHVWWALKKKVVELHPELLGATGKSEADIEALIQALREAWDALPESLFQSLIKSMKSRVQACVDAKGWHTKY